MLVAPTLGPGPQFLLSKQDGEYRLAAIFIAALFSLNRHVLVLDLLDHGVCDLG